MSVAYNNGNVLDGAVVIAVPQSAPSGLVTTFDRNANIVSGFASGKVSNSLDQRYLAWEGRQVVNLPVASGDYATGTNAAAIISLPAAGGGRNHVVTGITCGYSSTPTSGSIKIEDGSGVVVFKAPISSGGSNTINFYPPKIGSSNTAMIITLAAGGSGVVGDLNVIGRRIE
jgi:hypothetical protein